MKYRYCRDIILCIRYAEIESLYFRQISFLQKVKQPRRRRSERSGCTTSSNLPDDSCAPQHQKISPSFTLHNQTKHCSSAAGFQHTNLQDNRGII